MRTVLAAWFEAIGLTDRLGLGAVDELFSGGAAGLLHPTSAVPYPTFRRTVEGWRGWNGYGIGSLEHRMLKEMIVGPELRALQDAVIVPLGKATRPLSTCADRRIPLHTRLPSPIAAERAPSRTLLRPPRRSRAPSPSTRPPPRPSYRTAADGADDRRTTFVGDEIHIVLTGGNVRNNHFYLRPPAPRRP